MLDLELYYHPERKVREEYLNRLSSPNTPKRRRFNNQCRNRPRQEQISAEELITNLEVRAQAAGRSCAEVLLADLASAGVSLTCDIANDWLDAQPHEWLTQADTFLVLRYEKELLALEKARIAKIAQIDTKP